MSKVKLLKLPKLDELEKIHAALKRELPMIIANQKLIAEVTRAKFEALVEQGFTPDQALELSKEIQ